MSASQTPSVMATSLLTGVLTFFGLLIRGWLFPLEHSPWSAALIGGTCSFVAFRLLRLVKGTTS